MREKKYTQANQIEVDELETFKNSKIRKRTELSSKKKVGKENDERNIIKSALKKNKPISSARKVINVKTGKI